jgi:hypothetical protein
MALEETLLSKVGDKLWTYLGIVNDYGVNSFNVELREKFAHISNRKRGRLWTWMLIVLACSSGNSEGISVRT